jgi:hypothetical protein
MRVTSAAPMLPAIAGTTEDIFPVATYGVIARLDPMGPRMTRESFCRRNKVLTTVANDWNPLYDILMNMC